jgi:hypothetical protein
MEKSEVINLVAVFLSKNVFKKLNCFVMPKRWDCDPPCQKVPEQEVGWIRKKEGIHDFF